MHRIRVLTMAVLSVLILVVGFNAPGAQAQGRGRGQLLESYREEPGSQRPAWVSNALERGLQHFEGEGKARDTLQLRGADVDDIATHVRVDQFYRGVPVFGGQLIAHINGANNVESASGRYYEGLNLDPTPRLAPGQALAAAQQALGYHGNFAEQPIARLLVLPLDDRTVLAYQVGLRIEDGTDATANHQYFIDANDGSIAFYYNDFETNGGVGTGHSLYSGTVNLIVTHTNGTHYLRDGGRGNMETIDMRNRTQGGYYFTDADNVWGNGTTSSPQSAAVDAQFGAGQTWDYYLYSHNRRGIDGNGFRVLSRVHYGRNYNNAFWNGSQMTYGDGDGVQFRPLVSLDVVGHEITHGLTDKTADLIYAKESGASNESFSDIFGTAVEFYSNGAGGRAPDYLIAEDIYLPQDAEPGFRNMKDPGEDNDPDHYSKRLYPEPCSPSDSNDQCGVHSNSGIQNNAFYLLAEGGTNKTSGLPVTGIGRDAAERIFYRALTVYLFPSATFKDVRAACLQAAADVYGAGSAQYNATSAAWTAVGVQ